MRNTDITLRRFGTDEHAAATDLIRAFWLAHNGSRPSADEAALDLAVWSGEGHEFYFIMLAGERVGFVHLGSRGESIDWLEDIFVLPALQGRGIGSEAIRLAEAIVSKYSSAMYIEAAARNARAVSLYRRIGYDCLNTVTVRKDFAPKAYTVSGKAQIRDIEFDIREKRD